MVRKATSACPRTTLCFMAKLLHGGLLLLRHFGGHALRAHLSKDELRCMKRGSCGS